MKPCCQIGAWPDREAIDADIRAGRMGIRSIAARYGCTKGMVEKHRKCLDVTGGPPNGAYLRADEPELDEPLPGEETGNDARTVVQTTQDSDCPEGGQEHEPLSVEIVRVKQDSDGDNARARGFPNPKTLVSRLQRVEYVADLVASGQWHGRMTARRLQSIWGYASLDEPWRLRREAQMLLDAHRPPLIAQRDETVQRLQRIGRLAKRTGDLRVAVVADVEASKIAGTYQNGNPSKKPQDDAVFMVWYQRMLDRLRRDGHDAAVAALEDEARIAAEELHPAKE